MDKDYNLGHKLGVEEDLATACSALQSQRRRRTPLPQMMRMGSIGSMAIKAPPTRSILKDTEAAERPRKVASATRDIRNKGLHKQMQQKWYLWLG